MRKQTCDLVTLMGEAAPLGAHYLFMEDDFVACPHLLRTLAYAAAKADALEPAWLALRLSYGMNGARQRRVAQPPFDR